MDNFNEIINKKIEDEFKASNRLINKKLQDMDNFNEIIDKKNRRWN